MSQPRVINNDFCGSNEDVAQCSVSPSDARPNNQLEFLHCAKAAVDAGQTEQAKEFLTEDTLNAVSRIVETDPSAVNVIYLVAMLLWKTGQPEKAKQWYEKALKWGPDAAAYDRLGCLCQYMGRMSEAVEYLKEAVEAKPDMPQLWAGYARALLDTGQTQQGIELLKKAVDGLPQSADIHSNFLFRLHYLPELDPRMLFKEHSKWGRRYAPIDRAKTNHTNIPEPDRRLRIGYISSAFRRNSVAYFFESLLDGHDRQAVEIYGYGNVEFKDELTERLKAKFDQYRNIRNLEDKSVSDLIEGDRIDILIDLAGHTGDNCLTALAYKPSPVQVTYLGYPDTTGMQAVDYRLTDALAEPPEAQTFYTEKLVFLPDGFLCYKPPDFAPTITPLPAEKNGYITFGSFNNNCKINPVIAQLWAEVLRADANSRLLLKIKGGDEDPIKDRYYLLFEQFAVDRSRIDIIGWKSPIEHLQLYSGVDIALDTFPYNGTTTTCEALWMGVPVISLVGGKHHASRVGLSILSRVGLKFFAASKPSEYVAKAVALGQNRRALAQIRCSMRARIAASGLCHAKAFARHIEAAYRKMWHNWCRSQA